MNRLTEQARTDAGLPGDYRKILAIVREADGPVQVRVVGERLGWTPRYTASWNLCGRR